MFLKSVIILFACLFVSSCLINRSNLAKKTYSFDRENLYVYDSKSIDSNCISSKSIRHYTMLWLLNKHDDNTYTVGGDNYFDKIRLVNFKICNCQDTTWARKMILEEIMYRHPFQIIDTVKKYKAFEIIVRDSSNVNPKDSSFLDNPAFNNRHWALTLANSYQEFILEKLRYIPENKKYNLVLNNSISISTSYYKNNEIYFPIKYMCHVDENLQEFSKYWKDSMGVDIKLVKEYYQPIKMLVFDK